MANIEKIKVGSTSYDVRDASAAHALIDIAAAGDNIEFARDIQDNYSVQGTGVTVSSAGVASGFSSSSYIYTSIAFWNNMYSNPFVFQTKFKIASLVSADYDNNIIEIRANPYTSGSNLFTFNINRNGRLRLNENAVGTATISIDTDYWLKAEYANGVYTISLSTDGSTFTQAGTITSTPRASTAERVVLGGTTKSSEVYLRGSIDLTETYFKDGNGNTLWAPVGLQSDKIIVNATVPLVDQTYNSSSANAQSGVAIAGAGFLQNADSTSTNLSIKSSDNTVRLSATGGSVIKSEGYSVSIGYNPSGSTNYATKVGTECYTTQFGTAIGYGASAGGYYSIAIGSVSSPSHHVYASGLYSIAMGYEASASEDYGVCIGPYTQASTSASAFGRSAKATASYAIQIGKGTNSTANTFSVGLSDSNNYQLLDSSGNVPHARLSKIKETYTNPALTSNDGICTWTVTHTLGTTDFVACVYDTSTGAEIMFTGIHTDTTTYTIEIASSSNISAGAYKVVMIG